MKRKKEIILAALGFFFLTVFFSGCNIFTPQEEKQVEFLKAKISNIANEIQYLQKRFEKGDITFEAFRQQSAQLARQLKESQDLLLKLIEEKKKQGYTIWEILGALGSFLLGAGLVPSKGLKGIKETVKR